MAHQLIAMYETEHISQPHLATFVPACTEHMKNKEATMPTRIFSNHLLDLLPDEEISQLSRAIELVDLKAGDVLFTSGDEMNYTYFPVSATLSIHHDGIDNVLGGIAMVGKEGMAGVSFNLMTTPAIPCKAIVQIAGKCFRLSSDALLNSFKRSTDVMLIILRYTQAFLSQMAQTALCNWSHPVDQRLALWLLVSNKLSDKTQFFVSSQKMADMLAVTMEQIVAAILKLEGLKLIRYTGECFHMLDQVRLKSLSCDCYSAFKNDYQRLLPKT
jgi:CRP-like cAMP-binding protein